VSVPADQVGSVGSASPTSVATPATGTANPPTTAPASSSWWTKIIDAINPLSGATAALPNVGLIAVGAILIVGALLISQKQTVIQVASTAAKAGAA
jgi:hypothetical protein